MKSKAKMTRLEGQFRRLYYKLRPADKIIIGLFLVVLLIGLVGSFYTNINSPQAKPAVGGTLVEGIVAKSNSEADADLQNLTGMGLVRFDSQGRIVPGLAANYSISSDNKVYTFTLMNGLDSQNIANQLKRKAELKDYAITVQSNQIIFTLKTPFAPILSNLTKPDLQPGPYTISKRSDKDIILIPNKKFPLGGPYISKIEAKIYPDQSNLDSALKRGVVMSGITTNAQNTKYQQYKLTLDKDDVLIFNLKNEPWSNLQYRQNLANKKRLAGKTDLVVTLPDDKRLISEFKILQKKYRPLNVELKSNILPTDQFNNAVDSRDFQALLVGIDYGRDPDPYPFFHSSQIDKGQNLAGFKSDAADKLLEKARLTTDSTERDKLYSSFQDILKEQVPVIFINQMQLKYEVSRNVKGVKINSGITPSDRFANVWQWYIKTK